MPAKKTERIPRPPRPRWKVTCTNQEWAVPSGFHVDCVTALERIFEMLGSQQGSLEVREDIYHKGLFKVRALNDQQDAHIVIVIPGQPQPVVWRLVRDNGR